MKYDDPGFEAAVKSELAGLVRAKQYTKAVKLLNKTNVKPEPDGWRGAICEELGDRFRKTDPEAAEWFYRECLRRFEAFARDATCSADAYARSQSGQSAFEKLQLLSTGRPAASGVSPEETVLREFAERAERCGLRDFVRREWNTADWRAQSARVVTFVEDRSSPEELVALLAFIALQMYTTHMDGTEILASWLRAATPRLSVHAVDPEFESLCRRVARNSRSASPEITELMKGYLRAVDEGHM